MRIGFLGYGEAAQAFRGTLAAADPGISAAAWDIKLADPVTEPAMRARIESDSVRLLVGPQGLGNVDWIVSAVTADQSLIALQALAPHLRQGQLVVDINSVSPARKRESAALIEAGGARYLDMAVMAPVIPKGHRTPVLVAGSPVEEVTPDLDRLGFAYGVAGAAPGSATAIKMVRSVFVKGLEAITVETLLAAESSGCRDEILASLSSSYPGLSWPDLAIYNFERVMTHGKRRAAEMVESGATLDALGLNGGLAREIAAIDLAMGGLDAAAPTAETLPQALQAILKARLERTR